MCPFLFRKALFHGFLCFFDVADRRVSALSHRLAVAFSPSEL